MFRTAFGNHATREWSRSLRCVSILRTSVRRKGAGLELLGGFAFFLAIIFAHGALA